MDEVEARSIFRKIISGVEACHRRGIIHRDLKLENVLFSGKSKHEIKIVDFGIAGQWRGTKIDKTTAGTLRYMPPEVIENLEYKSNANPALDMWSLGVMLYVMLFNSFPFDSDSPACIKSQIVHSELCFPENKPATAMVKGLIS